MTDKEKIRAEIERLYNKSLEDKDRQVDLGLQGAASLSYGMSKACKELLFFIDHLQEEPVSKNMETDIAIRLGSACHKQVWHGRVGFPLYY